MAETNPIVEKIKKLLALATSSNPHEAALAAARAQELMVKYAIEEAQLNGTPTDGIDAEDIRLGFKRIPVWQYSLSQYMAPAFFCRSFSVHDPRDGYVWAIKIVGRAVDREVHKATFAYLVSEIEKLADKAWALYKKEIPDPTAKAKAWKNSFYLGCIEIINRRLTENATKIQQEQNASTAIVLVNKAKAVDDFVADNYEPKARGHKHNVEADGFVAGAMAGQKINLDARATKHLKEGK